MGTIDAGNLRRKLSDDDSSKGERPSKRIKKVSGNIIYRNGSDSKVKKTPRKSCLVSMQAKSSNKPRRAVRFAPSVKQFDGLLPSHQLLDHLAWKFLSFKNGRGFKSPTDVFHEAWHMGMASELEAVHALMNDLERRLCNARAIDEVAVLPGGGGRLVQLNYTHLGLVRLLTEMVSAASEMFKNVPSGAITPPSLSDTQSFSIVSPHNKFTLFSSSSLSAETTQVVSHGEVSKRIFSLPPVVDDSFDDDDEEDDEDEEENEEQMDNDDDDDRDILVVDGIELTKRDVERMEERLARLQHEFDSGEISSAEHEVAQRHLRNVLDAYRCMKS